MLVLMTMSIAGTGTNGFVLLTKSTLKNKYPMITVEILQQDDFRDAIYEEYIKDNPVATQEQAHDATFHLVRVAYRARID